MNLSDLEWKLLKQCGNGVNILSSDRAEDRAKIRLKKLGLLTFDRPCWKWRVTTDGWSEIDRRKATQT